MLSLLLASLIASPAAEARSLQFTLDCKWDLQRPQPIGGPRLQVVKTAFQKRNGKWDYKYTIVARPLNPNAEPRSFDLVPAGSGDEDYNEFKVKARNAPVQGAYIQNAFKWASIVDNEGYGAYRCE